MQGFLYLLTGLFFICCARIYTPETAARHSNLVQSDGRALQDRILVPEGYTRMRCDSGSFGQFLRQLDMKPDSSDVMLYDGKKKTYKVHAAVVDMEIGKKDLQQCADACIRLRAEYLWKQKQYDKIHFNLTNGFRMDYNKWREGYRLNVDGNKTSWVKKTEASNDYSSFRKYLDIVFTYAGTLSVEKEIKEQDLFNMQPGDIFVIGGSPGHAAMVADVAVNKDGEKIFLLAQGYMPAQDIHIIVNPNDEELSPWFHLEKNQALETMEWTFPTYTFGRFE